MKLTEKSITEFVDLTASDAPAPGGGAVAALEGALGVALVEMVCALTLGKKKYAEVQELAGQTIADAEKYKARFEELVDGDAEAFNAFSAVLAMPKDTEEEKAARKAAMQLALKGCTQPPLELMELSLQVLELIESVNGKLNASAVTDIGCAAVSLRAAIQESWLNVLININNIQDEEFAGDVRRKGEEYLKKALPIADRIYDSVLAAL